MAEIGLGKGAGVGGFASGFGKGLSQALLYNRERSDKKEQEDRARRDRVFMSIVPSLFASGADITDVEPYFKAHFPEYFPEPGKGGKNAKPVEGPWDKIKAVLGPVLGMKHQTVKGNDLPEQGGISGMLGRTPGPFGQQPVAQAAQQPSGVSGGILGNQPAAEPTVSDVPPDISQTAMGGTTPAPAAPAASQRRMAFGVAIPTPEEKAIKDFDPTLAVARRMVQTGAASNLGEALDRLGLRASTTGSAAAQSVAGEAPDEKGVYHPAFAVFNRVSQKYIDPDTGQPIENFRPRTSTGSVSFGQDRESISREPEFGGMPFSQQSPEGAKRVNEEYIKRQGQVAEQRGLGTGRAQIATELQKPIGPTAAGLYNVPPTTTLAQLNETMTLRPDQQQKIASLGQVDALLGTIEADLPKVFPEVEPGMWGRLQTQFSLGAQRLAADSDLAELDATINAALAQVAQLSGQPGSRLSDRDIDLAKSTLANLSPSIFGGDTLATAQARLSVLRGLLSKAQASVVVSGGAAPPAGAKAPPPAGPPGMTNRNGILYGADGKELPGQR